MIKLIFLFMCSTKNEQRTFLTFSKFEIVKCKIHLSKHPTATNNIDIDKMMIYNKVSFGKKVLIILLDTKMMKKLSYYE